MEPYSKVTSGKPLLQQYDADIGGQYQSGYLSACVTCECVHYHKHLPAEVIRPFSREALCGFDHVAPRWLCFISVQLWAHLSQIFNHGLTTRAEIETLTGPLAYLTSPVGSPCSLCCAPQCIASRQRFWIVTVAAGFTWFREDIHVESFFVSTDLADNLKSRLRISALCKNSPPMCSNNIPFSMAKNLFKPANNRHLAAVEKAHQPLKTTLVKIIFNWLGSNRLAVGKPDLRQHATCVTSEYHACRSAKITYWNKALFALQTKFIPAWKAANNLLFIYFA